MLVGMYEWEEVGVGQIGEDSCISDTLGVQM